MALLQLKLSTIRLLDPALDLQFRNMLKRLVNDCRERPLDKTPRLLTLQFAITPKLHDQSAHMECDQVQVDLTFKSKVPTHRSKPYEMMVHRDDSVSFNPDSPEDPEAKTLFDEDERQADGNPE